MSSTRQPDPAVRAGRPAPLVVAASLVAVEGGLMLLLAALELRALVSERATMAVTVTAFFLAYGVGLLLCALAVTRGHSWARSPIVLAQLIQLGVAWNYRDGATTGIAVGLAVVAGIVIAGLLHPASVEALAERPEAS